MAWIQMPDGPPMLTPGRTSPDLSTPTVASQAEIIRVFGLRPDLLQARVAFVNAISFGGSGLGRYREELIATSVAGLLACRY